MINFLNAIDMNKGEILWKVPLGEYPEFTQKGIITGTENYGGPVVTAGGVIFIAATREGKIRAFNKSTGRLLWQAVLPAAGFATPAVYQAGGRQCVVIACGGGKMGAPSGDAYVAFALGSENEGVRVYSEVSRLWSTNWQSPTASSGCRRHPARNCKVWRICRGGCVTPFTMGCTHR